MLRTPNRAAEQASSVVPSDSADLSSGMTRGLYIGGSGDVKVDMADGSTVTFVGLAAGVIHPLRVKRIYTSGTTATNIIAVY